MDHVQADAAGVTSEQRGIQGQSIFSNQNPFVDIHLPAEVELRVRVPLSEELAGQCTVAILEPRPPQLPTCDAEVCGCPMAPRREYPLLPGQAFAIWTWRGCALRFSGPAEFVSEQANSASGADTSSLINSNVVVAHSPEIAAVLQRSPSSNYLAVHEYHTMLHLARLAARDGEPLNPNSATSATATPTGSGPRVVVCGGPATGRHSVAKTLANCAVRQPAGWAPTFLDLDPQHPTLGPPGSIGTAAWEYGAPFDEGTGHLVAVNCLVGFTSPLGPDAASIGSTLAPGYVQSVQTIASLVRHRCDSHSGSVIGWSGCVAVLPSFSDPTEGAGFVTNVANAINATHILVVGDELLHSVLMDTHDPATPAAAPATCLPASLRTAAGGTCRIDRVSAALGALDRRTAATQNQYRSRLFHQYFHGAGGARGLSLVPPRREFSFLDIDIYSFLVTKGRSVVQRLPENRLEAEALNRVAALYRPDDVVGQSPVLCFCHVDSVDNGKLGLRLASLLPDGMKKFAMVVGTSMWFA